MTLAGDCDCTVDSSYAKTKFRAQFDERLGQESLEAFRLLGFLFRLTLKQ